MKILVKQTETHVLQKVKKNCKQSVVNFWIAALKGWNQVYQVGWFHVRFSQNIRLQIPVNFN